MPPSHQRLIRRLSRRLFLVPPAAADPRLGLPVPLAGGGMPLGRIAGLPAAQLPRHLTPSASPDYLGTSTQRTLALSQR